MNKEIKSPLKAIRAKCMDCSGYSYYEIEQCWAKNCPLYPFRLGKNPYRTKKEYTEEQLKALKERMFKLQKSRKTVPLI